MKTMTQDLIEATWTMLYNKFGIDPQEWRSSSAPEYLGLIKDMGLRVHTCGIEQALAYLRCRKDAEKKLADDLDSLVGGLWCPADGFTISQMLNSGGLAAKMVVTDQVLSALEWLSNHLVGAGVNRKGETLDESVSVLLGRF